MNRPIQVATRLEDLDAIRSAFTSSVAHELRTPLAAIIAYADMLLDEAYGPLNAEQQERISIMLSSAQYLSTCVNNLIDASRIEAGRIQLGHHPTDLAELIRERVAILSVPFASRDQEIMVEVADGLPPAFCDRRRTAQIIDNVLSNASKFSSPGTGVQVLLALDEEEGFLQLSITDQGAGISPADQSKIFHRFFRGRAAREMKAEGIGLGLYVTRSLVQLQGGLIWFESQPGRGTTFHVTFPPARDGQGQVEETPEKPTTAR